MEGQRKGFIMKILLVAVVLFAGLFSQANPIDLGGLSAGAMIGNPTALTTKGHLGNSRYFDAALAYSTGVADGIYLHGTYLLERDQAFKIEQAFFNLYYGIGARLFAADNKRNDEEIYLGPRAPVGVNYYFKDPSIEVFAELAVSVDIIPETEFDIDLAIGARYWF